MKPDPQTVDTIYRYAGLPVHFTFLEGQFAFRCAGCSVPCCREAVTLTLARQQEALVVALGAEAAVASASARTMQLAIGTGGCPALSPSGCCSFHVEHGPRSKPATCAMFPFTQYFDLGSFLVVSPHLNFVCPLSTDGGPDETRYSYAEIVDGLRHFFGDDRSIFASRMQPGLSPVTLAGETVFRDSANGCRFRSSVEHFLGERQTGSREPVNRIVDRGLALLQLERMEDDLTLSAQVLPLLPTIRTQFYELPGPLLDGALAIGYQLALREARASRSALVSRRIASSFASHRELLALLAQSALPVQLSKAPVIPSVGSPEIVLELKAVLEAVARHPGDDSIDGWLKRHGRLGGPARVALLRALAKNHLEFFHDSCDHGAATGAER